MPKSVLITPVLLLLFQLAGTQPACYASCLQRACLSNNSLACTSCDAGSQLVNEKCYSVGSQSEPIRILSPRSQTQLNVQGLLQLYSNRNQTACRVNRPDQTGILSFLNLTLNPEQIYTVRFPQIKIRPSHEYIIIKFNAILFNQQQDSAPQLQVLIIDQADKRIFNDRIRPNQTDMACTGNQGSFPINKVFFVNLGFSSRSHSLLFSVTTLRNRDQLGLADINIYFGNCNQSCATCQGPGANQCLTCQNMLAYDKTSKTCATCPFRFYKVKQVCLACPYNCLTCQFNQIEGGPVCKQCQPGIVEQGATAPSCIVRNYVDQSLKSIKFNDSLGWKSSTSQNNLVTLCGTYSLVGGLQGFGGSTLSKTFTNLPVHNRIWLKFTLFLIDQYTGLSYRYYVNVNGVPATNPNPSTVVIDSNIMNTNQCGTERQQFVNVVILSNIPHTGSNATVEIIGQANYFGIRDFTIGVVNLTNLANCDQVNGANQCIRCKNGYSLISGNGSSCTTCPAGTYEKNGACLICPIYCRTCTSGGFNTTRCESCDQPLKFDTRSGTCNDQNNNLYTVALSQKWNNSLTDQQWTFYPKLQNKGVQKCGPYSILGSTQIKYRSLAMSRTFNNLPQHQGVSMHFYFYQIDDYDGVTNNENLYNVRFKFNGRTIPYNVSTAGYNICGNGSYDSIQKITINDPSHNGNSLGFQVQGNRTKFGISNMLLFLSNCKQCKNNGISYQLQVIPMYSVESEPDPTEKGMKSKIIFENKVYSTIDPKQLFQVKLVNRTSLYEQTQVALLKNIVISQSISPKNATDKNASLNPFNEDGFGRGQKDPYAVLAAQLYANRQLRMFHNLIKDQLGSDAVATLLAPDSAYGYKDGANGQPNLIQSLRLQPVAAPFSRYDDIYSISDSESETGARYRANTRNLMNLFRGISILALFIGLISFFFGLSQIFDDLFLLCQLIFVHIFIQSPWISATMKLPVGAMNLVQFMAWLPLQARNAIQNAIIPSNHYQRSPIVYQQYWKDITFARAIYHTILFLAAMLIFYWLIRLVKALRQPKMDSIAGKAERKYRFVESHLNNHTRRWFSFLDRVIRFTFFTVMWASCLQFIYAQNEPGSFMGWNLTLCIVMFVLYILYVIIGYIYLRKQSGINADKTFQQKFNGIRIRKQVLWYFLFRYFKLLAIAFLIGQLYKTNPLAVLIPLMAIHATDAILIAIFKPFILDAGQSQHIVSKCTRAYWTYYRISHIIENILFFILQLIMIIMYGVRERADKGSYMSIGYACCAFIIMLLINGLIRLVWGFVRIFEVCLDQKKSKDQEIKSQNQVGPFKYLDIMRANLNNDGFQTQNGRTGVRQPSIDNRTRMLF